LKVLRIRPERKFCKLGDLSSQNGWKQKEMKETKQTSAIYI